ncbi:MAG: IS21-like element helper ATPase IstB [Deltaproteobacteria bacterium]
MKDIKMSLKELLCDLHLPTIRDGFAEAAEQARREGISYEKYLLDLLLGERDARKQNRIVRLLKDSKLPLEKSLEAFEQTRLPNKVRQQMKLLADGEFLDRRENILIFGNPGTGKTHLLCAIGQALVKKGRSILFTTCNLLVQELLVAKRDLKLPWLLRRLSRFEGIIIDDIGYVQQSREEMEVLFTLLAERYERGSILLTSNLEFSKWEKIFKDPMVTAAAIDRLVHHSIILELNAKSYRMEKAREKTLGLASTPKETEVSQSAV